MDATTVTCYRHPDREAPLRCTRCERPICLEDAIDAPVGFLCPEDARQAPRVRRAMASVGAPITRGLVYVLVGVYLIQQLPAGVTFEGVTWGRFIAQGEWYRLLSGAFLHGNLLHIGFNGYLLWQLGHMLEPALGRARYAGVYAAGLAGGSLGVVVLSWDAPTLGASGAVFGLMGAAMVMLRRRGVNPWQTDIGSLVLLNLALTFFISGISIGGHVGGFAGGALAAMLINAAEDRSAPRTPDARRRAVTAAPWVLAIVLLVGALLAAEAGPLMPEVSLTLFG